MLDSVLLHSRFCDVNTELTEFAHYPGHTPTDIAIRELLDEILDFLGDRWTPCPFFRLSAAQ